jgi:hypothetical protein
MYVGLIQLTESLQSKNKFSGKIISALISYQRNPISIFNLPVSLINFRLLTEFPYFLTLL